MPLLPAPLLPAPLEVWESGFRVYDEWNGRVSLLDLCVGTCIAVLFPGLWNYPANLVVSNPAGFLNW